MIFILQSDFDGQANWYKDFYTNLEAGLNAVAFGNTPIVRSGNINILESVLHLGPKDYLFVTHYAHLDTVQVRQTPAKVIFHHHGSGVHPYNHWVDRRAEMDHVQNVIDIHTFCLPTQEKIIKAKYNLETTVTIGFPMDFKKYEVYKAVPKRKKIVVAGSIDPSRQFYLATYLLKDLLSEYEIVFSVCENPDSVHGNWSDFYAIDRFIEMGYKFKFHSDQGGFYRELSDASHIFTCSLGDVISISVLEGYLCGCIPVVPAIFNGWPMFMDYISNGYHPFDKSDVEDTMGGSKTIHVDLNWFKPELVAKRLLEKIQ